jgi:hypothetical protein
MRFGVQNRPACTIEGGLGVTLENRPVSGTSREYGRTNHGVGRNVDHSNVTPSRKPLRHTTWHGRLNPSAGMTKANLTGIAPVLSTSNADPVADKSRTTQSIFSRSYSILAGFAKSRVSILGGLGLTYRFICASRRWRRRARRLSSNRTIGRFRPNPGIIAGAQSHVTDPSRVGNANWIARIPPPRTNVPTIPQFK